MRVRPQGVVGACCQDRAVVFARLAGAYWLGREDDECAGHAEAGLAGCTDHVVAGEGGLPQWMGRARVVMLPTAVLVVACVLAGSVVTAIE